MRIFIGFTDVANVAATYAKGFRALGHETFTVVWKKSYFYPDSQYDLVIDGRSSGGQATQGRSSRWPDWLRIGLNMMQLPRALSCDLFVIFAYSIVPSHVYFPLLRSLRKRIVSVFWGSDIRYWYALQQEMRALGVEAEIEPFIDYIRNHPDASFYDKLRTVRTAERHADLILSQAGYGQLQRRPYMRANIPLDLSQFRFNVPDREIPLVLHAPSVRGVKGTEYVLADVEQLKQEGVAFEFRLIEKMPNAQVRELLAEADIVVDELFSETVGALSAEAMAAGNVALVRYMPDYAQVPPGCPAVNVTTGSLHDKLREVILDRDLRRRLAHAGRPYVETHNDHVQIARQILYWLESGSLSNYAFVPTFYKTLDIPPELLEEERKNRWNVRRQYLSGLLLRPAKRS